MSLQMNRVKLLSDDIIKKIAAGEVVERPASVVKELVENSLDAGACHITVELEDGGKKRITIQDDGSGIHPEDCTLALQRHATSKLRSDEDLFSISTLGFRGEALAAISSVSDFSLCTRTANSKSGTKLELHGDFQEPDLQKWQGDLGTRITVSQLFSKIPVRKKFLKSPETEFAHCYDLIQALALVSTNVTWSLYNNGKLKFSAPAIEAEKVPAPWRGENLLRKRWEQVVGKDEAKHSIYVQEENDYGRWEALISPPGHDKATQKHIMHFVNGRWVKDKVLSFGISRGYHSHLLKGRHPQVLSYFDCDPSLVDVNVHPSKTQLRFQYPGEVQGLMSYAIRKNLRDALWAEVGEKVDKDATSPSFTQSSPKHSMQRSQDELTHHETSDPIEGSVRVFPKEHSSFAKATADKSAHTADKSDGMDRTKAGLSAEALTKEDKSDGTDRTKAGLSAEAVAKEDKSDGTDRTKAGLSAEALTKEDKSDGTDRTKAGLSAEAVAKEDKSDGMDRTKAGLSAEAVAKEDKSDGTDRTKAGLSAEAVAKEDKSDGTDRTKAGLSAEAVAKAELFHSSPSQWRYLRYIGSYAKCYLLFEEEGSLLSIDQHAFHERILYERLCKHPKLLSEKQRLMLPEALSLSSKQIASLKEHWKEIESAGFKIQILSEEAVEIQAVPTLMVQKPYEDFFVEFTDKLAEGSLSSAQDIHHLLLATMACHSAVRAGEELSEDEIKSLLSEADNVDFYHNCPHGRRVFKKFEKSQVARWFDR